MDFINLTQSKAERKPQQYTRGYKKRPSKFLFCKFHIDNLTLAAVELKKKQTSMTGWTFTCSFFFFFFGGLTKRVSITCQKTF